MAGKPDNIQSLYSDASKVLKTHLKEKMRKKSPYPPPSEAEVRQEAMRILEEFLKKQLQKEQTLEQRSVPCIDTAYQRVEDEECLETDGPTPSDSLSQSDGNKRKQWAEDRCNTSMASHQGSIHSLLDENIDFPFADDVEDDVAVKSSHDGRSRSLPAEILSSVKDQKPTGLSKSLSPSSTMRLKPKVSLRSVEECANCNKNQLKEATKSASTSAKSDSLQPESVSGPFNEGKSKSSSPFRSSTDSRELLDVKTSGRRRFRSGSISSSDTADSERVISPDRKKKSVFTRLKERLDRSRTRERRMGRKDSDKDKYLASPESKGKAARRKPRSREKKKQKDKDDIEFDGVDDLPKDVLEEQHRHIHGHIEQHHYENGDHSGVLREQELWESTDINDLEKAQRKHRERHQKVKESLEVPTGADSSDGGFWNKLKRMASFRKRPKKSIKASRSAEINRTKKRTQEYGRSVSVGPRVSETEFRDTANGQVIHRTTITTAPGIDEPEGVRLPQIGGGGGDGNVFPMSPVPLGLNEGADLDTMARGRSFILDFESDEVIRRKLMASGQVDTVIDRQVHRHITDPRLPDIDADGLTGNSPSPGRSEEEKEKLYGEIADRLAEIGDSYVSPLSDSAGSGSLSHHHHHHGHHHHGHPHQHHHQREGSQPDDVDGEGLTALERELRDCLRQLGDNFSSSGQINISPETTTNAAMDIVKHATYQTFSGVVSQTVGEGHSWDQLAMVFFLTKRAVSLAGAGGAVAMHVKDMAAQYLADKYASWVVDQGGWDTVLETSSTDSELD